MFTFHHGFWIYFFTRRHAQVWQFVAGAMLPDYVYFILMGILIVNGQFSLTELRSVSPQAMMPYLPLYPWTVKIDLAGHSVVVWTVAFVLSLMPVIRRIRPFITGWGTHLLMDGLTHGAYANYYLYPLSLYAVHSPVSYWEPQYFAYEFQLVNNTLMVLTALYIIYEWQKKK
jgi:hypothetical protein